MSYPLIPTISFIKVLVIIILIGDYLFILIKSQSTFIIIIIICLLATTHISLPAVSMLLTNEV